MLSPNFNAAQLFQSRFLEKKSFHDDLQCSLTFDDSLLTLFSSREEIFNALLTLLKKEVADCSALILKINPAGANLFLEFFMPCLHAPLRHQGGQRLIDLIFNKIVALQIQIVFSVDLNVFCPKQALLAHMDFFNILTEASFDFSVIYNSCREIIHKSPSLTALRCRLKMSELVLLQRLPRDIQPPPELGLQEFSSALQDAFSSLLKNSVENTLRFFYGLERQLPQLTDLSFFAQGVHFKYEFPALLPEQGLVAIRGSDHLVRAFSQASQLKSFELEHLPETSGQSALDLNLSQLKTLFSTWAQRGHFELERVRITIPIEAQYWDFYSALVEKWPLRQLSLRLKNTKEPEHEQVFLTKEYLDSMINFGEKVKASRSLKGLTFITDLPHSDKYDGVFLKFVRLIARNFGLDKTKLHLDNTLGNGLLPWRYKLLSEFQNHPTLSSMSFFYKNNHAISLDCSLKMQQNDIKINLLWHAMLDYQREKKELIDKASQLSTIDASGSQGILIDHLITSECAPFLKGMSMHHVIMMGGLYSWHLNRHCQRAMLFIKQHELYYFLAQSPSMGRQAGWLFDNFLDIVSYLTPIEQIQLLRLTGGIFKQIYKNMMPEEPHKTLMFSTRTQSKRMIQERQKSLPAFK